MTELVSKWVSNNKKMTNEERSELQKFIAQFKSERSLQRICIEDPDYPIGYHFNFNLSSFTSVNLLNGDTAGQITLKSSDECIMVVEGTVTGFDVDYSSNDVLNFSAKQEQETIISGRFIVSKIEMIESPVCKWDTLKVYTIKQIG